MATDEKREKTTDDLHSVPRQTQRFRGGTMQIIRGLRPQIQVPTSIWGRIYGMALKLFDVRGDARGQLRRQIWR